MLIHLVMKLISYLIGGSRLSRASRILGLLIVITTSCSLGKRLEVNKTIADDITMADMSAAAYTKYLNTENFGHSLNLILHESASLYI